MIVQEEVVMVGVGIVHMGGHQVLLIVRDQVPIMAEPAAQFMIDTMGQCMTGAEVQIMGGTGVLVQCMISAEILIMGGIEVLSMVDTAGIILTCQKPSVELVCLLCIDIFMYIL